MKWASRVIALLVLLPISLLLAWLGLHLVNKSRALIASSPAAAGTVVEVYDARRCKVEFQWQGKPVIIEHDSGSDASTNKLNDKVEVLIDREKPEASRVKTFVDLWASSCVVFFFAAAFSVVSLVVWRLDTSSEAARLEFEAKFSGMKREAEAAPPPAKPMAVPDDNSAILLRGPSEWWIANLFWACLGLGLAALVWFSSDGASWQRTAAVVLGALWFLALTAWAVHNKTLGVTADSQGVELRSLLQSTRVEWGQIAALKRIEHGRHAVERAKREWRTKGKTSGYTPPKITYSLGVYDAAGEKLLDLSEELQPAEERRRLVHRLEKRTRLTVVPE
jgi:hypothetical protein